MISIPHVTVDPAPEGVDETDEQCVIRWNRSYWAVFMAIADEMSALFNRPHNMECECMNWPFLLYHLKKNYAYKQWEHPEYFSKIKISGLPFVKRDRCDWVRNIGTKCVAMIINHNYDSVVPFLNLNLNKLCQNLIPLEELSTSISLKEKSEYKGKGENLIQLTVARKIQERTGVRPQAGSRMTYVVVKGDEKQYMRGELIDYIRENKLQVDLQHYLKQLVPVLELIFMHHSFLIDVLYLAKKTSKNIDVYYAVKSGSSLLNFFQSSVQQPVLSHESASCTIELSDSDPEIDFDFDE
jgi:DNA polymerase elongation subunit (family B)